MYVNSTTYLYIVHLDSIHSIGMYSMVCVHQLDHNLTNREIQGGVGVCGHGAVLQESSGSHSGSHRMRHVINFIKYL